MDNLALQVLAQVRKAVGGKDEVISKAILAILAGGPWASPVTGSSSPPT